MGLQNAMVSKLSGAGIRTTHMTGIVTDIGIELGKLCYWNASGDDPAGPPVLANRERLKVHATMLAMFLFGGVTGAVGFQRVGYASTIPLVGVLIVLAIIPLFDDLRGGLADPLARQGALAARQARTFSCWAHALSWAGGQKGCLFLPDRGAHDMIMKW